MTLQSDQDPMELISVRNFEYAAPVNPLREFKGTLESLRSEYNDQYKRTYIFLSFIDVEVIDSATPYDFPIAELRFPYSKNPIGSYWGICGESLVPYLQEDEDIRDTIGRRYHMKMIQHDIYDRRIGRPIPQLAWEVIGLEGEGTTVVAKPSADNAVQVALNLLDGKTLAQFNQAALADPVIRANDEVRTDILNKVFVQSALDNGVATVDEEGVYHLVTQEG